MSACTIPFGSQGKVEVGKRKADGMTTEIILNQSEAAACRKTLTRPLPKGEEIGRGGVEKVGRFFNTSYYPRAGGAVE